MSSCLNFLKAEDLVSTVFRRATLEKKTFLVLRKLKGCTMSGILKANNPHKTLGNKNCIFSKFRFIAYQMSNNFDHTKLPEPHIQLEDSYFLK